MSQAAYSSLKAAWHQDKIEALRAGQQVVPSQVQLILSDLCNQSCHFCSYRMEGGFSTEQFRGPKGEINPNRMIPLVKCLEILDDCHELGVKAIQFTGGGEPTVHPEHLDIFHHALALGLECGLVTNGILLRDGWEDVLPRFAWIRVSVDAGNAEDYARIRSVKPAMYEKVMRNLGEMRRHCDDQVLLGVGFVATPENWLGLHDLVGQVAGLCDYVRISAMFSTAGADPYEGLRQRIEEQIRSAKLDYGSVCNLVDLFSDRIADLDQGAPDYEFCGYQQFNMYIGGNQKVYRCCTTSYTKHGEVGDLSRQRLKDWFYSPEKEAAYSNFNARSCITCQFNEKNRTVNYMLDPAPVHVNFV